MTSSASTLSRFRVRRDVWERLLSWGPQLVLAGALAFLGLCTLTAIARPGLQYDEALFVNAALGGHYPNFVSSRLFGVPTMVMPYSGALKSWLYYPLFKLVGVSVTSIRLPVVALLVATTVIAFQFSRRLLGAWPAALLALLMATDPAFMTMAKADWGPVALSAFFRIVALAAYFAWARTQRSRWLWVLAGAIVLGVFNKLDFLAFAAALGVAAVVVDHRGIAERLRGRLLPNGLPLAALGMLLVVEYVEIVRPARAFPVARSNADLLGRVSEVWNLARRTMDGTAIYPYMTTQLLSVGPTAIVAVTVVAVALAAVLAAWRLTRRRAPLADDMAPLADAARTTGFVLVLLLVETAALILTPEAVGPHHAMLLWPLPALLGVSLVSAAGRLPGARSRAAVTVVLACGLLWLAGTQIRVAEAYRVGFADGRAWATGWTPEVYAVTDAARRAAPGVDGIVTADWGFGNQLLALGGDDVRRRLDDAWGAFAGGSAAAIDQVAAEMFRGRRSMLIFHREAREIMPGTAAAARALLGRFPRARIEVLYRGDAELAYIVDDRPRAS